MNVTVISRRLAATGAAAALAAAGLVGATGTAAQAAPATGDYACTIPGVGSIGTLPMTADASGLQELIDELGPLAAGMPVPPGLLTATTSLALPAPLAAQLAGLGVVGGSISDFGFVMGDAFARAPQTVTSLPPATGGDVTASGANEAFTLPAAGTHAITMPGSFTFAPASAAGPAGLSVECASQAPASIGEITTELNPSTTEAKARKKVKKGKRATVTALVNGANTSPSGDVVALKGKREIGRGVLKNGTAKFKLDKLKRGKHKVAVEYLGDAFQAPSSDTLTIKVVKPRKK